MITKFWLSNEYGTIFNLDDPETGLFTDPSGMGYGYKSDYLQIGSKWVRSNRKIEQESISGKIVFWGVDPYVAQSDFLRFLRSSKSLTIHRQTSVGEYLKDVDIASYDFGRVKDYTLEVKLKMNPRGLWYSTVINRYIVKPDTSGRTTRYNYRTPARFDDLAGGKIIFSNDGSVPAPMKIIINGPIVNPVVTLKQGGTEIYKISIPAEIASGERIEYSSIDDDLYIDIVSGSTRTSIIQDLDIEETNFFSVPVGYSEIYVSATSALTNEISVTMYKQYLSV